MNGHQFHDKAAEAIYATILQAGEPLETKEVEARVATTVRDVSRSKMIYRLQNLRAENKIHGKFVGPGKGVWIWWANQTALHAVKRELLTDDGVNKR